MEKDLTHSEIWARIIDVIDHWVEQRGMLLTQYADLANIKTFSAENALHGAAVQGFCQSMVDYLSLIHFEVFEQVSQNQIFPRAQYQQAIMELMRGIQISTDALLDFNDKYLALDDLDTLTEDLSALGEEMAQRFELEDQVIALLQDSRKEEGQLMV
ncbi:MAG TPA: Rsd/AlgQ family anti-sigma factor [Porticoccaceae bacterium]|nr:Rsd/AlgQ family anti-sigma factor [Porticoccaceae bacterium]